MDLVEGLAEIAGKWVGGGDDVWSGLDLDDAIPTGGLDEFAD